MQSALMAAGALVEALGWRVVAAGRASVWRLMPAVLLAMGIVAALVRHPIAASRVSGGEALGAGVASGLLLYAATRAFVSVAGRWRAFRRHVVRAYEDAAEIPLAGSLALSLLIVVPGEELFWRGLFQARLDQSLVGAAAGVWTWLAYVGVNASSASLPIVAGAVVGGGLWTALAVWSGGVLASLASHMLWTGLMLALPPRAGREGRSG